MLCLSTAKKQNNKKQITSGITWQTAGAHDFTKKTATQTYSRIAEKQVAKQIRWLKLVFFCTDLL